MRSFPDQFRNCKSIIIASAIALTVLSFGFEASAYSVSPLVIDRTLKARDEDQVMITIENSSQVPITIYPTVNAISLDDNGTISEFITPTLADGATTVTRWLAISRAQIDIQPGSKHEVPLNIKMPPAVEPGQYHAFIGLPNAGNRPIAEGLVAAGGVPGVVVTIEVKKDTVAILRLGRFFIDRFVTNTSGKTASVTLVNNGSEILEPKGEIIFYDTGGNEVGAVPFNGEGAKLEPGAAQDFSIGLPESLGFGKHKAYLDIEYGSQLAQVQDTTFFYIVPLKTLIGIFFALLALTLFLAWKVHRRYGRFEDSYESIGSVPFTVRSAPSTAKDHDIDLKKPQA